MKFKSRKIISLLLTLILLMSTLVTSAITYNAATTGSISYLFTGDNSEDKGYAEGTITLTAPAGTYWLYWADDTKALDGYTELAKLTVSSSASHKMYPQTVIPVDATKLIAIQSTSEPSTKTVASATAVYEIPESKTLGHSNTDKKYTFGSYSDVHIDNNGSTYKYDDAHWASALDTAADREVDFIITSGDAINNDINVSGIYKKEWQTYTKILADSDYCNPIYEAIGNHEIWQDVQVGTNEFIKYTGLEGSKSKADKAYFAKDIMGDHFIFMSLEGGFYPDRVEEFSEEQLDWLEGLLKEYSGDGKNIYIIEHSLFYKYGAGDRTDGTPYYDIPLSDDQESTRRFKSLLETYKDTIFISGHTHISFAAQLNYSTNDDTSAQMVHNSSVGGIRKVVNGGLDRNYQADESEGYIVDVYDDAIIFNGANLHYNEYDPNCCYIIRTSKQAYDDMSLTDPTTKATTQATANNTTGETSSYYLKGSFNSWGTSNPMYLTTDSEIITTTLQLSAGTYTFKLNSGSTWYGNDGAIDDTTKKTSSGGWVMSTSAGNCTLEASGGYYTFNFNTSSKKLNVLYSTTDPNVTEPSETTVSTTVATTTKEPTTTEATEVSTTTVPTTVKPTATEASETTESTATPTTTAPITTKATEISTTTKQTELSTTESTVKPTEAPVYELGDVNQDSKVNIKDATAIQKDLAEIESLSDSQKMLADVNGDKVINILDVTIIQKYIALIIPSFDQAEKTGVYSAGAGISATLTEVSDNLALYYRYSSYDCYQVLKKEYRSVKALNDAGKLTNETSAITSLTTLQNALLSVVDPNNVDNGSASITVYFENSKSWSNVYAYCWTGSSNEASWPGKLATLVGTNSSGNKVYSYTVNTEDYANIIFSNGSSSQTTDIALTEGNILYYITSSSSPFAVSTKAYDESDIS